MDLNHHKYEIHRLSFAGSCVEIACQGLESDELIARLFKDVPTDSSKAFDNPDVRCRLVFHSNSQKYSLYLDDVLECADLTEPEMALHLVSRIGFHLINFSRDGLVLHAGLVSKGGHGLLLAGNSGSGKSMLTAWLLKQGFDYLTDELVYLPGGRLQAIGFSRPLNFKSKARKYTESQFHLDQAPRLSTEFVDIVPWEWFCAQLETETQLERIFFPRYQAGEGQHFQKITKAKAGLGLMQCLANGRNLPGHGFELIADLTRRIPAYQLVYGGFDQLSVDHFVA